MKRTGTIAAFALFTGLAGCQDVGLDGNIPLEEAENHPPSDLVAAVHAPTPTDDARLVVDGRLWVPTGTPLSLDAAGLRAVGSASGRTVHARTWDRPPYDALFTRVAPAGARAEGGTPADTGTAATRTAGAEAGASDAWQEWAPVIGRSGAVPGAGAADEGHAAAPGAPAGAADTAGAAAPDSAGGH